MSQLFYCFYEIATWTKGPEDLPRSSFLLVLSLLFYVVSYSFYLLILREPEWLSLIALDLVLVTGFVWVLITVRGYGSRLLQTLSAFFGATTIVHLTLLAPSFTLENNPSNFAALISVIAIYVTVIWQVMIHAHIFHRALEINRYVGVALAVLMVILAIYASSLFIEQAAPVNE